MRTLLAILLSIHATSIFAKDTVVDLNGYRLQQFFQVAEYTLGESFTTVGDENYVGKAHRIGDDAYMIFFYLEKYKNNIDSIQITGSLPNTPVFLGLSLGDSETAVANVLGPPDEITEIQSPDVRKLGYRDRNYSVEIDSQGNLYSVLIFTTKKIVADPDHEIETWPEFKSAILSRQFSEVEKLIRPDVEIYKDGVTLSISNRYSDFVDAPDAEILEALFGKEKSVIAEIQNHTPVAELRLIQDFGIGEVYKFKTSEVLEEIVFFPYNGRHRVYEIRFR